MNDICDSHAVSYSTRMEDDNKAKYDIPKNALQFTSVEDMYTNRAVLAPMVRVNILPFRILAREYGCSLLYSEEIIAKKLKQCIQTVGSDGTIKVIDPKNANKVILHTYVNEPLIVQLGVSNGIDAVQAAEIVSNNCKGIDINMGCPKLFSLQGDMGSALLHKPE
uniref:tRNA-dihydrouridine(20) synthase [NAD(P)+]-like protein n=1 Tax=Lygus hesperus TaxID=30085 RepID=A0A0A9WRI0_LYGHE